MIEMKTSIINIFYIFTKVEENMNITGREMENTKNSNGLLEKKISDITHWIGLIEA